MDRITALVERLVVGALLVLLMVTILVGTVIVGWSLIQDLLGFGELVANPKALFDVFGLFVAVLVGVELLRILRHLVQSHEVDTVLVAETALIALCNKVITLNLSAASWTTLLAIAALILAVAASIYALKGAGEREPR
jgi:uncharacterized membrane protein (DUF373 family)